MANNYYSVVVKLIKETGFERLPKSQQLSGSHEMWKNSLGRKVSVPRKIVKRHTATGFSKMLALTRRCSPLPPTDHHDNPI